jgi:rhomboid protease GluP
VSPASKVCEQCGRLNAGSEQKCNRCGARFPGQLEGRALGIGRALLGRDAPMVRFFIALCVIVFGLMVVGSGFEVSGPSLLSQSLRWGALHPLLVWSEPWRLVSAVFVHLGVLHLLMNMGALASWGAALERTLGSPRFVITFVGTGIVGFVVSVAWSLFGYGAFALTAGASGGLFGLMSFDVGYLYKAGDPGWKQALIRAVVFTVLMGLIASVNNAAHIGGGVAGAVFGYFSYNERVWREFGRFWKLVAATLVVLSLVSIGLGPQSATWRAHQAAQRQNGRID